MTILPRAEVLSSMSRFVIKKEKSALMDIPGEHQMSGHEGVLVSLVRSFTKCEDDGERLRLKTAFYEYLAPKFYDRLKKAASKLYSGIPGLESKIDEVFDDTFLIAFDEISTFEMGNGWGDDECQKVMLNWLSKIANNLLLKLTRSHKKEKKELKIYKNFNRYDLLSAPDQERKEYKQVYDKAAFDEFWAKLNPMSKEILLTCAELETIKEDTGDHISGEEIELLKIKNDLDSCAIPKQVKKIIGKDEFKKRNTDHLPDDVLDYLTTKYNVTPAAIRKAKQRALEGLRNCKI